MRPAAVKILATNGLPTSTNNVNINSLMNVNLIYYPENSKNSDVQQWNFGVERQLGADTVVKAAYVGTHMDHLASPQVRQFSERQLQFAFRLTF